MAVVAGWCLRQQTIREQGRPLIYPVPQGGRERGEERRGEKGSGDERSRGEEKMVVQYRKGRSKTVNSTAIVSV